MRDCVKRRNNTDWIKQVFKTKEMKKKEKNDERHWYQNITIVTNASKTPDFSCTN